MPNETECFECGHGMLVPKIVELTGSRNGEEFTVLVPGLECSKCGFKTIDNSQSGDFTRAVSDAYRQAHAFLSGWEIRDRRLQLRMSQQTFADYVGVGVASVKRWESGHIQDKAMDVLIRLKTDPEVARRNLDALKRRVPERHVLSAVDDMELEFTSDWRDLFGGPSQIHLDSSFSAGEAVEAHAGLGA